MSGEVSGLQSLGEEFAPHQGRCRTMADGHADTPLESPFRGHFFFFLFKLHD